MRTRIFKPGVIYRVVEIRQPASKRDEQLLNAKLLATAHSHADQDPKGFLVDWDEGPFFTVLTGLRKEEITMWLPVCRILRVKRQNLLLCTCSTYKYPHRAGSGDCPYVQATA